MHAPLPTMTYLRAVLDLRLNRSRKNGWLRGRDLPCYMLSGWERFVALQEVHMEEEFTSTQDQRIMSGCHSWFIPESLSCPNCLLPFCESWSSSCQVLWAIICIGCVQSVCLLVCTTCKPDYKPQPGYCIQSSESVCEQVSLIFLFSCF